MNLGIFFHHLTQSLILIYIILNLWLFFDLPIQSLILILLYIMTGCCSQYITGDSGCCLESCCSLSFSWSRAFSTSSISESCTNHCKRNRKLLFLKLSMRKSERQMHKMYKENISNTILIYLGAKLIHISTEFNDGQKKSTKRYSTIIHC